MTTITVTPHTPVSVPPAGAPVDAARTATGPRSSVAPFVAAALGAIAAVGATEWLVTALQLHMHV